jgi:UDP-N-acetylmuramoylalanine--D-glutamate ligase
MKASGQETLEGRRVVVVGLAETGLAVANFLARAGSSVVVSEAGKEGDLRVDAGPLDSRVEVEMGEHRRETFLKADLIVPSPGVPRDLAVLQSALGQGVTVVSEIELAARFIKKPMLATTGTNGKSTTVTLLGAMLAGAGFRAPVVGNIGLPLISMVGREGNYDCLVVEVSSFQLEWVDSFRPSIAAILNITEDHLDRYRDFEDYLETKLRISARQGPEDYLVLNYDDPRLRLHGRAVDAAVVYFSHGSTRKGVFHLGRQLMADLEGSGRPEILLDLEEVDLQGVHNQENVMAAAAQALLFGASPEAVRGAAAGFTGLPHRNELVAEMDGVRYIDDSKATNVGAVKKSLEGFREPVILIAGGREKGAPYTPLAREISSKVRLLILIGEARGRMGRELGHLTETLEADTLEQAVCVAGDRAAPGDVVLLSPACSSFDMFRDYKMRGEVFRETARRRLPCRKK